MLLCAVAIGIGLLLAQQDRSLAEAGFVWITIYFFHAQDQALLVMAIVLLTAIALLPLPSARPALLTLALQHHRAIVAVIAALVLTCGLSGRHFVFGDHAMSHDEVMAQFDATVFSAGQTIAPRAPEWRPYSAGLTPNFFLPIANHLGVISVYLPINAAIHALVGIVGDPRWTDPLLASLSVILVFLIARRLWPDRPGTAVLCSLLLATSSQVLMTAMTDYAMTGHLALNLLWLHVYLWNNRKGSFLSIAIGFLACGLHQLVFHPLFVAPFILNLFYEKRYRTCMAYIVSYAIICLFWMSYPKIIVTLNHMALEGTEDSLSAFIHGIPRPLPIDFAALLTLTNSLRFLAWQNILLVPLVILASRAVGEQMSIARALLTGIIMTISVVTLVQAYQGLGWGFRYLHGLIGSFVLLAGYGWVHLSEMASTRERTSARNAILAACAYFLVVSLPTQIRLTHDFVAPYAAATTALQKSRSDVVLIDTLGAAFSDVTRNDPFLRNSPKLMSLLLVKDEDLISLCSLYHVSLFDREDAGFYGIMENPDFGRDVEDIFASKRALLKQLACDTPFKRN